ncbi:hypothetical protein FOZ62_016406 [Perkinsus olseni]|uniref:Aluminum-activated malate transporter 1 n=1 Tax=Perkinsus olseni TaxID=32597 RepID=A0A7J6RTB4_PEROL|nr:hypothetical protein FOZ62_016406 [Perkinsus olseni]
MSLYSSLSLTGAQLLTGIVGAFTIGVGAIPLMVPINQSKREILIYTMQGPVWALFSTHLNFQATVSHCLRSLFGTWFASAVGCLYYLIVQTMCGGTIESYQREAAIAFAIPFTFLIALCHRSSACKLRKVIGFEAAASSFFTPVALFLGKPYEEALWNSIFESYGIIVSFVTIALLDLFGLLPQAGTSPLRDFDLATSDFFDVLCMSMMSGNRHASTVDAAQSRFEKALNRASASTKSAKVRSILWRMASFLYSLRKSVAEGVYPEAIFDKLWKPTAADLLELRSEIRAALLSDDGHVSRDAMSVREEAASFKNSLRGASVTARKAMREHNGTISTEEMARFNFAEEAVLHFAYIIADYTAARNEEMAPGKLDKGCNRFKVVRWCNDLFEFCVNWWQEPFFESNGMTLWEKLIYPAKITLTGTLTSIVLLLWGRVYPYMMSHVFWGFIAALFCMLPNTGATFNKVLRRVGGTLCALVAAVVCIFANPFDKAAFFVELLIVAFFGKVGSTFHAVGYGGPVFVLTWIIVAFQPSVSMPQPEEDTLWGVGWRMALTLVGVGMTSVLSCVVFPVFASVQLDTVSEETLKEQAKRVTDAVRQLVRLSDGDSKSSIVDEREELGELLSRTSNTRAALKEDAFAEVIVFGQWVMSGKEKRILQAQKSLDSLAKSTVCAYGACITCTLEIGQPATTELLAAISPHLEALATALERSIAQLEVCLGGGKDGEAIMLDDEVHLQMMRCKDSFNERREMLVSKFKEGSDRFNEVVDSGGSILYHALYALYLFTEEWNALEIFLAGRKHAVNYPLEPTVELRRG